MKERFEIVNIVKEIQETDIPKLAHYADKEANPLYPVPKLMDASELEKFYYMLMSLTSEKRRLCIMTETEIKEILRNSVAIFTQVLPYQ